MCVSGRHLRVVGSQKFFHQNSSIGKLSVLAVILGRIGRSVGEVHLITLGIEHRICPERLVVVAVVTRFTNVSCFVDQTQSVVAIPSSLWLHLLITHYDPKTHSDSSCSEILWNAAGQLTTRSSTGRLCVSLLHAARVMLSCPRFRPRPLSCPVIFISLPCIASIGPVSNGALFPRQHSAYATGR